MALTFNELQDIYSDGKIFKKLKNYTFGVKSGIDVYKEYAEELISVATCDGKQVFKIPDLYDLINFIGTRYGQDYADDIRSTLIEYYTNNMAGKAKTGDVEDDVKIAQAAIQCTMMAAYDVDIKIPDKSGHKLITDKNRDLNSRQDMQIFMGNMPRSFADKTVRMPAVKTMIKNNKAGSLCGVKFKFKMEGLYSDEATDEFLTKMTGANNTLHIKGKRAGKFVITPYYMIEAIAHRLIELAEYNILEVTQVTPNGKEKQRGLTTNVQKLREAHSVQMNDPVASNINCIQRGRVFLPILGVTALSRRTEQVNLHQIRTITLRGDFNAYINKANELRGNEEDEMETLKMESAIYALSEFCETWKKHPEDDILRRIGRKLGIHRGDLTDEYLIFLTDAVSELHGSKTDRQKREVLRRIIGLEILMQEKEHIYGSGFAADSITHEEIFDDMAPEEKKDVIIEYLKGGLCRVEIVTKDMLIRNVLCTKNMKLITDVYGKNYIEDMMLTYRYKLSEIAKYIGSGESKENVYRLIDKRGLDKYFDNDNIDKDSKYAELKNYVMTELAGKYDFSRVPKLTEDEITRLNDIVVDGYAWGPESKLLTKQGASSEDEITATDLYTGMKNLYTKTWSGYEKLNVSRIKRIYRIY